MPVADSYFVLKSSNKLASGILNGYEHCGAMQTFFYQPWAYLNSKNFILNEHLNRQQATQLLVADSEFVLKSSNKLATGILNDSEHCRTVQTFLKQPGVYLNSTNYI